MPGSAWLTTHLFLQVASILVTARLTGLVLRRLGQTQVVAEMLAGVMLGPSLLGLIAPRLQQWLFPATLRLGDGSAALTVTHPSMALLYALGQLGLILYMFLMGLELDTALIDRRRREAATISIAGVVVPMIAGGALGVVLAGRPGLFGASLRPWQAGLFLSAATAITAFPVLARIVHDLELSGTSLGTLVLGAAALNDVAAWCLLAVVLATTNHAPTIAALAIGGGAAYAVVMLAVARPLLARWAPAFGDGGSVATPGFLVGLAVLLLLGAAFTDSVGIHSIFGAFLAGVVVPRGAVAASVRRAIEPLTVGLLVPIFFAYSGLNTHLGLLVDTSLLGTAALVIVVGFLAKGGACALASRFGGAGWGTAAGIGALMNARGLMELILINIGLERGLITPAMFAILVLLTILTTVAAAPLFQAFTRSRNEPLGAPTRLPRAP